MRRPCDIVRKLQEKTVIEPYETTAGELVKWLAADMSQHKGTSLQ